VPNKWKGGKKAASKRYKEKNKEKIAQSNKAWYEKNKDVLRNKRYQYYLENKEKIHHQNKLWQRKNRKELKQKVVDGYGGKCVCCGEKEIKFLEIDHIHNDGAKDRKRFVGPTQFYVYLIKNEYPKDRYQLYCANCNRGKTRNGGICPHKTKSL